MEKNFLIMTSMFLDIYKIDNSHCKTFLKIDQSRSHGVQKVVMMT